MYVAVIDKNYYIASDPICFDGITTEYYSLKDNEFCEVSDNKLAFYNKYKKIVDKKPEILSAKYNTASKLSFSTYMEKEINEIPKVFSNIFEEYTNRNYFLDLPKNFNEAKNIAIIGCGTAYHSGLIGATYLQDVLHKPVKMYILLVSLSAQTQLSQKTPHIFL